MVRKSICLWSPQLLSILSKGNRTDKIIHFSVLVGKFGSSSVQVPWKRGFTALILCQRRNRSHRYVDLNCDAGDTVKPQDNHYKRYQRKNVILWNGDVGRSVGNFLFRHHQVFWALRCRYDFCKSIYFKLSTNFVS